MLFIYQTMKVFTDSKSFSQSLLNIIARVGSINQNIFIYLVMMYTLTSS